MLTRLQQHQRSQQHHCAMLHARSPPPCVSASCASWAAADVSERPTGGAFLDHTATTAHSEHNRCTHRTELSTIPTLRSRAHPPAPLSHLSRSSSTQRSDRRRDGQAREERPSRGPARSSWWIACDCCWRIQDQKEGQLTTHTADSAAAGSSRHESIERLRCRRRAQPSQLEFDG